MELVMGKVLNLFVGEFHLGEDGAGHLRSLTAWFDGLKSPIWPLAKGEG